MGSCGKICFSQEEQAVGKYLGWELWCELTMEHRNYCHYCAMYLLFKKKECPYTCYKVIWLLGFAFSQTSVRLESLFSLHLYDHPSKLVLGKYRH